MTCHEKFLLVKGQKDVARNAVQFHTLYGFGWINKGAGNETFLAVAANYPVPIGIFSIQNCNKLSAFHADIVFISGDESVQDNVPTGRILSKESEVEDCDTKVALVTS